MLRPIFFAAIGEYFVGKRKPVRSTAYNVPSAMAPFHPCPFFPFPIQQMILSRVLRVPTVPFTKNIIEFADGTKCRLDVATNDKKKNKVVVICPGFGGSVKSPYCHHMAHAALKSGYAVVVYNRRAHVPESVSPTYPLHYDGRDMNDVLAWIEKTFPDVTRENLYGIGVSGGGNTLLKYAGEAGSSCAFKAIVSVCNGLDIDKVVRQFDASDALINGIITSFTRDVLANVDGFRPEADLGTTTSMRELEKRALQEFNDMNFMDNDMTKYYDSMSSARVIDRITVPSLCICSDDDVLFAHPHEYYLDMIRTNPLISVFVTSHGGHAGYVDRSFGCDWWCKNALTFLESCS